MLNEIANCLGKKIKALPFIERYGGLVRTVEKTITVDPTIGLTKKIRFPVSCNADPSCFQQEMYQPIVPNSAYKSIFYFEGGKIQPIGRSGTKLSQMKYRAVLRLVGWVNLAKLGLANCDDLGKVIKCVLNGDILGTCKVSDSTKATVGMPTICESDPSIFSKYSYYDSIIQNLIYPYGYFALDFPIEISINAPCIEDECDFGEPINCIEV